MCVLFFCANLYRKEDKQLKIGHFFLTTFARLAKFLRAILHSHSNVSKVILPKDFDNRNYRYGNFNTDATHLKLM